MGLDITAYSQLRAVGSHTTGWCEDDDHITAFVYDAFPQSFRGLPVLETRVTGSGDSLLVGGCYATTDQTKTHGFRAGSYSGYGNWRGELRRQFNRDQLPDEPFYELIWFADNEGTIGELAAADLLADFRQHAADYDPGDHFNGREKYADWTRAFELAADGGLVQFH